MGCLFRLLRDLLLFLLIGGAAAGAYVGNAVYEDMMNAPWDTILGIRNESKDLSRAREAARYYGGREVTVTADDGTSLKGTYIPYGKSEKSVILIHGIYSNRSMMTPYIPMYRKMGCNVLLIDLRGHGESGGRLTWGIRETGDLGKWHQFLETVHPDGTVGLHGVSLGAAMSLLYGGTLDGEALHFIIADSAYADLLKLGREKVYGAYGDDRLLFGMDVINPFFQGAMYWHTGKWPSDIEPVDAVRRMTAPVLFLHGDEDRLIPPEAAEELGRAAGSRRKEVRLFEGAGHAMSFAVNPAGYTKAVTDFLQSLPS